MGKKSLASSLLLRSYCKTLKMEEEVLVSKTKTLLSIYRDVAWFSGGRVIDAKDTIAEYASKDLDTGLVYLEYFSPNEKREKILEQVSTAFESRWLLKVMENALENVKSYPRDGQLYYDIIYYFYFYEKEMTDVQIMERISLERSSYYDRKKEAIIVYGVSFWKLYQRLVEGLNKKVIY